MEYNNIAKEKVILKGFIRKQDIKVLIGVNTHKKALDIFNKANALNEGYKDPDIVNVNLVLKVLGIKASDIFRNAEYERQQKKMLDNESVAA